MLNPRPYLYLAVVITVLALFTLGANVIASPQATTRYVSPQGRDNGTCESSEEPCASIRYALDQAADDDSIVIACGTYKENLVIDKSVSLMAETGAGDCAIVSAPAGMAVLRALLGDPIAHVALVVCDSGNGVEVLNRRIETRPAHIDCYAIVVTLNRSIFHTGQRPRRRSREQGNGGIVHRNLRRDDTPIGLHDEQNACESDISQFIDEAQ